MSRNRLARNRDIALTTLIDLLVQIIFVFTLILISADVMGNESHEQGWVTPEVWKTLISIFDVDPRSLRDAGAQVADIKGKGPKVDATGATWLGLVAGTLKPWLAFTRGMVVARAGLTELRWLQQVAERLQNAYER